MWFERFGYDENPFEVDPFKGSYSLVNNVHLLEDIEYMIHSGKIFFIEGPSGSGKTMFLREILNRHPSAVYIDAKKNKSTFNQILQASQSALKRMIGTAPKKKIVLIDNAQYLSTKQFEHIKHLFDEDIIKSICFATTQYSDLSLTDSFKDRVLDQIMTIPKPNQFEALRIIRDRFADHFFLNDQMILKIFKISDENIKQTLLNCQAVCSFVVNEGRGEVLPKYIGLVIKKPKPKRLVEVTP